METGQSDLTTDIYELGEIEASGESSVAHRTHEVEKVIFNNSLYARVFEKKCPLAFFPIAVCCLLKRVFMVEEFGKYHRLQSGHGGKPAMPPQRNCTRSRATSAGLGRMVMTHGIVVGITQERGYVCFPCLAASSETL